MGYRPTNQTSEAGVETRLEPTVDFDSLSIGARKSPAPKPQFRPERVSSFKRPWTPRLPGDTISPPRRRITKRAEIHAGDSSHQPRYPKRQVGSYCPKAVLITAGGSSLRLQRGQRVPKSGCETSSSESRFKDFKNEESFSILPAMGVLSLSSPTRNPFHSHQGQAKGISLSVLRLTSPHKPTFLQPIKGWERNSIENFDPAILP